MTRQAGRALFVGVFIYNVAVLALLVYAGLGLEFAGFGLWPAVGLLAVMSVWCAARGGSTKLTSIPRPRSRPCVPPSRRAACRCAGR